MNIVQKFWILATTVDQIALSVPFTVSSSARSARRSAMAGHATQVSHMLLKISSKSTFYIKKCHQKCHHTPSHFSTRWQRKLVAL
jgi:hypothetical protein